MSAWTVRPEPSFRGYQVEWEEEELLLSRRNHLFRMASPASRLEQVAVFPATPWKALASRLRPAQRLLRFLYYNVLKLPDGRLFDSREHSVGWTGSASVCCVA